MNASLGRQLLPAILLFFAIQSSAPAAEAVTGIGRRIPTFVLTSAAGEKKSLADFEGAKCFVVVFMGTQCPIANAYVPDLNDLQDRYRDQGVYLIGINSNPQDSAEAIKKHVADYRVKFPVLIDEEQLAADVFEAKRTPEAFVLDHRLQIRYQGRIDDRVGYSAKNGKAKRSDVEEAVRDVLEGKTVRVAKTDVQGCLITRRTKVKSAGEITFARHVSRILQDRCANCHHPGTAAPFSLLTHEDAENWSEMIKETVLQRRMPPWDVDPRYGKFSNDLRLTKQEVDTLVAWIDNGTPFGDKADLPPPRHFEKGWSIGKPDKIFAMPREYRVKDKGTVEYQWFVTPTNYKEDMWIQASEARPGNWKAVHHIIAFIRPKGSKRFRGLQSIGGYAPGEEALVYPKGVGRRLPAGSDIVWQVHYTPTGKEEVDRSELGLVFCKEPPKLEAKGGLAIDTQFRIPPGSANKRVTARVPIRKDIELLSLMPHMHLRGKDFRYYAIVPNGEPRTLLNVSNYDFNWQHRYFFAEPVLLPKGTIVECVAHFDNSTANPANPAPNEEVRWGDQTWEEMMIGFFSYVEKPAGEEAPAEEEKSTEEQSK